MRKEAEEAEKKTISVSKAITKQSHAASDIQMARPTFLVAETEPGSALSVRKLVLETAKFNVITAHSEVEAGDFFKKAPALYAALIISSDLPSAAKVLAKVKKERPELAVISVSPNRSTSLKGADHHCSSHKPEELVELCRELFGDPRETEK